MRKNILCFLLAGMMTFTAPLQVFAETDTETNTSSENYLGTYDIVDGESVWMGWTVFESGNAGYAQAGGDGGRAYGRYQFDCGYGLISLLDKVEREYSSEFPELAAYAKYPANDSHLKSEELRNVWRQSYSKNPELFARIQDEEGYKEYYLPAKQEAERNGLDVSDPVIRGTMYSIRIRDGGIKTFIEGYKEMLAEKPDASVEDVVYCIMQKEAAKHSSTNPKYDQRKRWAGTQLAAAVNTIHDPSYVTGTLGSSGITFSAFGTVAEDFVKGWIEKYPKLSAVFKRNGWSRANKEWAEAIYSAVDWHKEYGIDTAGVITFYGGSFSGSAFGFSNGGMTAAATSTSKNTNGTVTDFEKYNSVTGASQNLTIPDNDCTNKVFYIDQGAFGGTSYGTGGRSVASSGCAIASFCMALNFWKLGDEANSSNYITPEEILQKMDQAYAGHGGRNKDYVAGAGSIGDQIFKDTCNLWGLKYKNLGANGSITEALDHGSLVIMACNKGTEFTTAGHFICITGYGPNGGIMVNDPNGHHANKSYLEFSESYLKQCCHGLYEIHG